MRYGEVVLVVLNGATLKTVAALVVRSTRAVPHVGGRPVLDEERKAVAAEELLDLVYLDPERADDVIKSAVFDAHTKQALAVRPSVDGGPGWKPALVFSLELIKKEDDSEQVTGDSADPAPVPAAPSAEDLDSVAEEQKAAEDTAAAPAASEEPAPQEEASSESVEAPAESQPSSDGQ